MLRDSKIVSTRSVLGNAGEQAVGDLLQKNGFTLICYNFRSRGGEVDIIARRGELVCFVEVKARTKDYFNSSNLITPSKQKKIIYTARLFCLKKKISDAILRFDVALVRPVGTTFDITYIPNAFCHESMNSL